MRILVYWEQDSWGGVDTHLLELLSTWPVTDDEFVLMVNRGNKGFARLRDEFEKLPYVRCVEVTSYSHNELNRRFRESGALRHLSKFLHFLQPLTYGLAVHRLQRQIEAEGPFDLLLANNGGYPAAWGTICAIEAGARAGVTARVLLVHHSAMPAAPFMGWFEQLVDRRVNRLASAVVCVSHATRSVLLARRWLDEAELRIRVIHNGITLEATPPENTVMDIRAVVDAAPAERLVGIAGRVSAYKGQEDLIFALARMGATERQQIRLVVIGSGDPSELESLARIAASLGVQKQVNFLGYVPGRAVDIIRQLDLLVVATRSFEGFGLTLIEAMSVGVPVLATSVGAIPEFVLPDCGVLVPPADPHQLALALTDFVANGPAWKGRADVALQRLKTSKVDMATEYRQLFLECLAGR